MGSSVILGVTRGDSVTETGVGAGGVGGTTSVIGVVVVGG
jgi:hypothetical protein